MTTIETTETRVRLFVDQNNTRAHLVLTDMELNYNERYALVTTVRELLGLTSDELKCAASIGEMNTLLLLSRIGLPTKTWAQIAAEISNQLNKSVHLITTEDLVALAKLQSTLALGEMITGLTMQLVQRAMMAS